MYLVLMNNTPAVYDTQANCLKPILLREQSTDPNLLTATNVATTFPSIEDARNAVRLTKARKDHKFDKFVIVMLLSLNGKKKKEHAGGQG